MFPFSRFRCNLAIAVAAFYQSLATYITQNKERERESERGGERERERQSERERAIERE